MTTPKKSIITILPVLFGFFIMGFCDVVGISTSYVKADFNLSETVAGFLPSMVFLWFLLLSVPVAIAMGRVGRKNMVLVSMAVTVIGMVIPFVYYSYASCMVAFALLGIGNTILQVSLNPLLMSVVRQDILPSMLTAGQVVKAISSFCGPFIAAGAVIWAGSWKMLFPVFAGATLLSGLWLLLTPIQEERLEKSSSFADTVRLLKDRTIFWFFLGIVFIVGLDVGMNTAAPKILMERCGMALEEAGFGSSLYFALRTIGSFLGAFLLVKVAPRIYLRVNMIGAVVAIAALFFVQSLWAIYFAIGAVGFLCAGVFSVIYSMAMTHCPDRANEISGLMIMGVFGGAIAPPLMGFASDSLGSQVGSVAVILVCALYLLAVALFSQSKKA